MVIITNFSICLSDMPKFYKIFIYFPRKAAIGGMSAGALGQFMASPTDLVKVQIQMEGKRRLEGKSPRVKNAFHAFQKIMKQGGIRGLWKGWVPNVQRAALVNLGDLTTYDTAKRYILMNSQLKDTSLVHIMSRYININMFRIKFKFN